MQHGSAYTVVKATSYSYGEWQNCGYQNPEALEPIVTKFDVGDLVDDMIPHTKIQTDYFSGGVPANG